MSLAVITTSIGGWDKYIVPFIDSIRKYEKDVPIIIVDAGSNYPAQYKDENVHILKTPELNCSEAQNIGLDYMTADWYLVSDCDVLCRAEFVNRIHRLPDDAIYGNKMHPKDRGGGKKQPFETPYRWLDGWIYAIPDKIYQRIGGFDENFEGSGFEDADYCWRAMERGFDLRLAGLPFLHLADNAKKTISPRYKEVRQRNITYLRNKWDLYGKPLTSAHIDNKESFLT